MTIVTLDEFLLKFDGYCTANENDDYCSLYYVISNGNLNSD